MTATDIEQISDEQLEQMFDKDVPCELDFDDNSADWHARLKCCGHVVLLCDECVQAIERELKINLDLDTCNHCGKVVGIIDSFSYIAILTRI